MHLASAIQFTMKTPATPASVPLDVLQCEAWKSLDWLVHGFSQRKGGASTAYGVNELNLGFTVEDGRETVLQNRERLLDRLMLGERGTAELVTLSQIHSAVVHRVADDKPAGPGDGMMTDREGKLLAILTADCVPVLLVDQGKRVVAAFHAGWRGTVQGIVQSGVAQMQAEFGSQAGELSAAIGPCIGACCYTVGEEVRSEFRSRFPYANELFTGGEKDGVALHLDLVEANRRQLLDAGLAAANIHVPGGCTGCQPDKYFSHRMSGGRTGRMMSVIGIRPNA